MKSLYEQSLFTKEKLAEIFNHSADIHIKSIPVRHTPKGELIIIFCRPIVNIKLVHSLVIPYLMDEERESEKLYNYIQSDYSLKAKLTKEELINQVFCGKLAVISNFRERIYYYDVKEEPNRQPEESVIEVSVTGPKDGFIENIDTNLGLVRKRLKTPSFVNEEFVIGRRSNTRVALLYIKDVMNEQVINDVREKLNNIDVDILQSRDELEELLVDNKFSLLPLTNFSGRPDFVVESLNQGRFSIIIDGAPTVIIAPINLSFLVKTAEDSNISFYYSSVERMIRLLSLFLTVFLPGFYTALVMHNVGQLPLPFIATITIAKMGLPFSTLLEMITIFIMFELFKEAGARLPKGIGQTVAVIGGLIIGDAAIRAGITSPTLLIVVGITAIAGFTLVNASLTGNVFFLRIAVLLISYAFGIFGFILSLICVFIHLSTLKSFGMPFLTLARQRKWSEELKMFITLPFSLQKKRNLSYGVKDKTRKNSDND
ncbi:spore germination protein [Cytobacillus kochii]|uniref:Spore germination protein n=1 Tax=Cytobacillus kochii TaxID=859143 RepID=A0A248TMW7_9BACI|nr:spore germination protein [Cytobacillus kochii]